MFKKENAKKNRKGRKCQWKESFVDDLVDIIVENEKYRQKLLLTNVKNAKNGQYMESVVKEIQERCTERGEESPYDVNQTRQKFRRCVQACRAAALKTKTTSDITRFQESKDYGQWFNKLMQYISTMDSCQREQAIEPSATMNDLECSSYTPSSNASLSDSTPTNSIEGNETPINKKMRKIFENVDSALTTLNAIINDIKESFSNNNSNELLKFLKEKKGKQSRRMESF